MGIRLDWEIEAEQDHRQQSAGEDPEARRRRWRARLRFFLVLGVLLLIVGGVAGAVWLRMQQVEWQIEQLLRDSIAAEVTALRIGDRTAFLSLQRSATDDWLQLQEANFQRYQNLKQSQDINLSGRLVDVALDGSRGRAKVEEIIDGVPYGRVWFYWRYEDGWRHVPPDYTFWGDSATLEAEGVTVRYREVDQAVAEAVAARMSEWLQSGCAALSCSPPLTIEIIPSALQEIGWSAAEANTLQMPSPFVRVARLDMPFDAGMQVSVASLLAERLVGDFQPVYPADADYLRQGIVSWLVKRFAQVETNSFLISSLAERHGEAAVGRLLAAMQPDSSASAISTATGTSLDAAALDWRDFLTWRLALESDLIADRDETNFLALYDINDEAARNAAYARFNSGAAAEARTVTAVYSETDANGTPQLRAVVAVGDPVSREEETIFRLVDGTWKRAN